jgi:hypothetical protein
MRIKTTKIKYNLSSLLDKREKVKNAIRNFNDLEAAKLKPKLKPKHGAFMTVLPPIMNK